MALLMRVRARWDGFQGAPGLSTFYFNAASAPHTLAEATTVAGRVRGAFDVYKTALFTSQTITVDPSVDTLDDSNGELVGSFGIVPPAIVVGTGIGQVGAPQVMPGLILNTGTVLDGRRVRGRSFIGPIIGSQTDISAPRVSITNLLDAFGVALITATPLTADPFCVVWHRPKKVGGIITRAGDSARVTSAVHSPKWFTLNSRRD